MRTGQSLSKMSKPTVLHTGAVGCKIEAQCKGGVRNDVVASIVAAGERRGLLGVGFKNMMRSWVMK